MAKASLVIDIWTEGRKKLPEDLPDAFDLHLEHVQSMCAQGFTSGEIVDERFKGWWKIEGDNR